MRRLGGKLLLSASDLVTFLGCQHATGLDLLALEGKVDFPASQDPTVELLRQKGFEVERDLADQLELDGHQVVRIPENLSLQRRLDLTTEAMAAGPDFIYQAALRLGNWHGFIDFLMRTDEAPSVFGAWSYEVADAKLASHVAPRHVVQVTVYSGMLATLQGRRPTQMAVALGSGATEVLRPDDFASYVRLAATRLQRFLADNARETVPEPCAHCEICRWRPRCTGHWEKTDHLSLVAFIRRSQRDKLHAAGITTTAGLAAAPADRRVPSLAPETLARLQAQARLQVSVRGTSEHRFELLPPAPGRGLARLPRPDPGDLFLDLEGDPLFPDGLEYLFGLQVGSGDDSHYRSWWGHDRDQERIAVERVLDFIAGHLAQYPSAYIYHYGNYEVAALRRLAMRHGTRESIVDDLLRTQKFVDLYGVVREGVLISEPHYSLKDVEKLYQGSRTGDVATAMESVVAYETWRSTSDDNLLHGIEAYNAVDCRSTSAARDWLLSIRPVDTAWFSPVTGASEDARDQRDEIEGEIALITASLLDQADEQDLPFRRLVADLLDFHRREQKVDWWALFDRRGRIEEQLIEDPECLGGLSLVGEPRLNQLSLVHAYRFPTQETKLCEGDRPVMVDTLETIGVIEALDMDRRVVVLRRAATKGALPQQMSIGPGKPVKDRVLRDAMKRFAIHVALGSGRFAALEGLLRREPPRFTGRVPGQPVIGEGQDAVEGAIAAVVSLDDSALYIQGPPGTGKTYTAAWVVIELMRRGKRVALSSHSHKAINNLCSAIEKAAEESGVEFRGYKKSTSQDTAFGGRMIRDVTSANRIPVGAQLVAGTAWLLARPEFEQRFDYLVVDEAGQVSLANLVVMGMSAKNILLVGDQMQLSQPIQGCHPGQSGLSSLEHLLEGTPTVQPDRGILLDTTWRMHPKLCAWVSEAVYDGRLRAHRSLADQALLLSPNAHPALAPHGLRFVSVEHWGRSQRSPEEIDVIGAIWHSLMGQRWRDRHGVKRPLGPEDVLIMAPYNIQVTAIRNLLPANARVGTVDRFQGQEAPVSILSMTSSSGEDLPRDVGFLFSRQRLNVAVSRARCLSVILASPRLLEVPCRTVEDLRLVNTLCHAHEWARRHGSK